MGINTGILQNAQPLTSARIAELEREVLEGGKSYAYLDENSELCFAIPSAPEGIKELAWHNAYMLTSDSTFVKHAYVKTGLKTYQLDKTFRKNFHEEPWTQDNGPTESTSLEGSGQEYYTLAPSVLSFRSTAPLDEFQGVQVNGQIVDPSNYELEEGSTIVKLSADYLNTLSAGTHEISVVSNNQTATGDFSVKMPPLNEYGFYYNQPYSAWVDGYLDMFMFINSENAITFATYSGLLGDSIHALSFELGEEEHTIYGGWGKYVGKFAEDGKSFICKQYTWDDNGNYNSESNADLVFTIQNDDGTADENYVYQRNSNGWLVRIALDSEAEHLPAPKTNINGADVYDIRSDAFDLCTNLKSFEFPSTFKEVKLNLFNNCPNLETVVFADSVRNICGGQLPQASLTTYNNCTYLGSKTNPYFALMGVNDTFEAEILETHPDMKVLGPNVFFTIEKSSPIRHIKFNEGMLYISDETFDSLNVSWASSGNRNIRTIELPNSLIGVGYHNSGLIQFPDALQLNQYDNAYYLGSATNPYLLLVRAITSDITSCRIHEDTKAILYNAFYLCNNLTSIELPDGLVHFDSVGDGNNVTSVCIPISVQSIQPYVFCWSSLQTVEYAGTIEQWKKLERDNNISYVNGVGTGAPDFEYVQCSDGKYYIEIPESDQNNGGGPLGGL